MSCPYASASGAEVQPMGRNAECAGALRFVGRSTEACRYANAACIQGLLRQIRSVSLEATKDSPESTVTRAYKALRDMALSFELRPGERVNESELSRQLGVSRTPLREALNRLVAEDFLDLVAGRGFFRKQIQPREVFELYQVRLALESTAVTLAITVASDENIERLGELTGRQGDLKSWASDDTVRYDERFHEALADLSGNHELAKLLRSINLRIRPLRHLGLTRGRIIDGEREHVEIVEALRRRDQESALRVLEAQISMRFDEVVRDVRQLYGDIYVT